MTEEQEEEDYTIKQYNLYNYGKIKTDKATCSYQSGILLVCLFSYKHKK